MDSKFAGLNIKTLGEAMRPENLRGEAFRLSREERDYIAVRALDSISYEGSALTEATRTDEVQGMAASTAARKIAALSNLLGDIGWERSEARPLGEGYLLGELFPVAQLGPWLEEWRYQDTEALGAALSDEDAENAQTKLGTGAILLARIEKWMACKEN